MKLIHVVSGMDPRAGGISQAVRTMIKGLTDQGINSEVVSIGSSVPGEESNDHFPIHFTGPGKSAWQFNGELRSWLKNNLQHYDVIVVHGLWQFHTYAVHEAVLRMSSIRPKVFVMPHGMLDPWFQKAKGREVKTVRNWIIWKLLEHRIIRLADGIFFTCETEKRLACKTFSPYSPKEEFVIGLGVPPPPPYSPEVQEAFTDLCNIHDKPYILFLGRVDVKKGVDLLVNAYLALKSVGYDLPSLVIAGPGMETPFGKRIKQEASQDPDIHFPGMLSGPAKWGAFYGCEAFVLPSHQENFGIAVVEALACARPVLISDQVNIWREIENEGGGIVEPDDLEGVKRLLMKWAKLSVSQKMKMSLKAREAYLENYSVEKATTKLTAVLT